MKVGQIYKYLKAKGIFFLSSTSTWFDPVPVFNEKGFFS